MKVITTFERLMPTTADAVLSGTEERPKGYWKKDEWGNISCSNCGRDTRNPHYPFFCCLCGADMRGGKE